MKEVLQANNQANKWKHSQGVKSLSNGNASDSENKSQDGNNPKFPINNQNVGDNLNSQGNPQGNPVGTAQDGRVIYQNKKGQFVYEDGSVYIEPKD